MSQSSVLLKPVGIYSYLNRLSAVPSGALLVAENVVINRDNIVESRRGYKLWGNVMDGSITDCAHQILSYKNRLVRHYGSGSGTTFEYDSDGDGTFVIFNVALSGTTTSTSPTITNLSSTATLEVGMYVTGTGIPSGSVIASIDSNIQVTISQNATASGSGVSLTFSWDIAEVDQGLRIKSVESNGNLYFTTSAGIRKISKNTTSWATSPVITKAGGIKALDVTLTLNSTAGFLTTQTVTAYRIVWGIKDSNNNEILGAPSSRAIIRNTSSASSATVDVKSLIPQGITTAHFYQLYRTAVFSDPAGVQDPGDEEQLVYEANPTNSDLTNGYITTTDITPESFRAGGANLYTNQNSGEGILQANDLPPLARDIATFKGYTFYSNTKTRQRLSLSLLSTSTLSNGTSTITVSDGTKTSTYTFKTQTITCTTHTNTTVDGITSTATLKAGQSISGTNFSSGTYIARIINATSILVSKPTTASSVGTTFIAGLEDASSKYIAISQFGTPSQQVDETARSLINVMNGQTSDIVYGYYLSGPSDVPGLMLFEARNLNQDAFHVTVDSTTTGGEFSPALPTSGSSVISTDEVSPNRIYYSKYQQPEAVPLVNFIDIGPQDKAILRILALRDSLFVLKEDGVYRLSGFTSPFSVYPLDFSTNIQAPDSAVVLNNLIYAFTSQGVCTISDTGALVISHNIEDKITKLLIPSYTNFTTATFGVSYESDRSYYVFTVASPTDTYATQCFRFNTFTSTWTQLNLSKRCGLVNPYDDKLYLAPIDINRLEQERKSFDRTDYADREISLTLGSDQLNETSLVVSSLSNISAGDIVVQTQKLTIKQFNRILTKLDRDTLLSPHNYVSTETATAGADLSDRLDSLIAHIRDDAGRVAVSGHTSGSTYTALIGAGSASFDDLQDNFNALMDVLNNDPGLGYKDYLHSTTTTDYEFPIISTNVGDNSVAFTYVYPLIQGPYTIYNHIDTAIQFVPQYFGDVSMTKQVSEGTLIFEDSSFSTATLAYSTDLSADFEEQDISGSGNGIFGNYPYGEGLYGGNGSAIPFRTLLPRNKQRARFINLKFSHSIGREIFSLYGCSLVFSMISNRGWR